MSILGKKYVFGVVEPKPLGGVLGWKTRIKMRPNEFALLFLFKKGCFEAHYIFEDGEHWWPGLLKRRTITEQEGR